MSDKYWGYVYSNGTRVERTQLSNNAELIVFLKSHLYDDQLEITDARDNLVFRSLDGVDLYSGLGDVGIDLPAIYQELRGEMFASEELGIKDREAWEDNYDHIGLSPGEVRMRQRAKQACRAAQTVEDIAALLKGTYFDAFLISEDKNRAWGYLDEDDCSVYILDGSLQEGWRNERDEMVFLDRNARVKHISSSEDVHWFAIFDPPEES
jgi:hypothetical protein